MSTYDLKGSLKILKIIVMYLWFKMLPPLTVFLRVFLFVFICIFSGMVIILLAYSYKGLSL